MSPQELQAWADAIKNAFVAGALLAIVVGGIRQWYVWGWLYRSVVKDRDEWKQLALSLLSVTERVASVAETTAQAEL